MNNKSEQSKSVNWYNNDELNFNKLHHPRIVIFKDVFDIRSMIPKRVLTDTIKPNPEIEIIKRCVLVYVEEFLVARFKTDNPIVTASKCNGFWKFANESDHMARLVVDTLKNGFYQDQFIKIMIDIIYQQLSRKMLGSVNYDFLTPKETKAVHAAIINRFVFTLYRQGCDMVCINNGTHISMSDIASIIVSSKVADTSVDDQPPLSRSDIRNKIYAAICEIDLSTNGLIIRRCLWNNLDLITDFISSIFEQSETISNNTSVKKIISHVEKEIRLDMVKRKLNECDISIYHIRTAIIHYFDSVVNEDSRIKNIICRCISGYIPRNFGMFMNEHDPRIRVKTFGYVDDIKAIVTSIIVPEALNEHILVRNVINCAIDVFYSSIQMGEDKGNTRLSGWYLDILASRIRGIVAINICYNENLDIILLKTTIDRGLIDYIIRNNIINLRSPSRYNEIIDRIVKGESILPNF